MCICNLCKRQFKNSVALKIHFLHAHTDKYNNAYAKSAAKNKGRKQSEETKLKISKSRKKYLQQHPEQVPYLLNHSSKPSNPELQFKKMLEENNITGWVYQYQNGIYQYDFAFLDLKIDIEIDGSTHLQEKVKKIDIIRDEFSKSCGWQVIRYTASEVKNNLLNIKNEIINLIINGYIEINQYYLDANVDYLYLKSKLKEIDDKHKQESILKLKNELLNSNIDFSKFGWVNKAAKILNIYPQKVNKWMKKNMPEFYEENCFKRKQRNI